MAVSVLTITHANIGQELLATAKSMLGRLPLKCKSLSVSENCDPDGVLEQALKMCNEIDEGDGILVLTDIYGSTPSNICTKISSSTNASVITGLNLPMLIRVMNYPNLALNKLVEKALSGAHDGIINCEDT